MRAFLQIAAFAAALAALTAPGPAGAFDLPPRAEAMLEHGRPWVEVRPDADGHSGQVRGAIDIAASKETIWALMLDCDAALRMVANLKSCRVLERDPQGRFDVREQVSRAMFLPSVRSTYRSDYDRPDRIRFHRIGGDMTVFEGEWRLTPRPAGVRVTYEARASAPFAVPGWIARATLRHDVPAALMALRREAEAR
ncbi:MAG: polyketide cyclase [Phenylobacterium sp.]|nr:polyketide cyclase [Phenylobacterium sp.]